MNNSITSTPGGPSPGGSPHPNDSTGLVLALLIFIISLVVGLMLGSLTYLSGMNVAASVIAGIAAAGTCANGLDEAVNRHK